MLRVRPGPPVDYSLCNQTVTLYHATFENNGFQCTRTVFHGAFFDTKKVQTVDKIGSKDSYSFLLILPSGWDGRPVWEDVAIAPGQTLFSLFDLAFEDEVFVDKGPVFFLAAGDKVFLGEGPEIRYLTEWKKFIPAGVPGLVVVKDVDVKYWNGSVCHIEAGG